MDDGLLILLASALALLAEFMLMLLAIRADESRMLDRDFERLARAKRVPWDSWWAEHGYQVPKATLQHASAIVKERKGTRMAHRTASSALALVALLALIAPLGSSARAAGRCDMVVRAPADLNARLARAGRGATICLRGSFRMSQAVHPRSGQTLRGPARIIAAGGARNGISPKESQARNVTIIGIEVSGFRERGIVCYFGTVARDVDLHHNLQNGFGCNMEMDAYHAKLLNSHLWANGSQALEGNTAGSLKFTNAGGQKPGSSVTIAGNLIEGGIGNGVWFDLQSRGGKVIGNLIRNHTRNEIRLEISEGPFLIARNRIRDTESSASNFFGIDATSTALALIRNNSVRTGAPEIVIREEERAGGAGYHIRRIRIISNRAQRIEGCGHPRVSCQR